MAVFCVAPSIPVKKVSHVNQLFDDHQLDGPLFGTFYPSQINKDRVTLL
jgi:hypothetical protein